MNIENLTAYDQITKYLQTQIKKIGYTNSFIVNEKNYLLADSDPVMETILLHQVIIKVESLKNKELYKEQIQLYEQFIKIVSEIVKSIAVDENSISISRVISRLIHEGYLSKEDKFIHTKNHALDIVGYNGINVIKGYGCCRHVSPMHQDIFHALNLENDQLACYMTKHSNPNNSFQQEANHVVNLIKYEDVYYGHDVYNQCFLEFQNGLTLRRIEELDKHFPYQYYRKPSEDIIFYGLEQKKMRQKIVEYDDDSKKAHLSVKELKKIILDTDDRFNNSKKDLAELKQEREKILNKKIL